MPLVLKKRRADFAHVGVANENVRVDTVTPTMIADARKSLRKIIVYLAERAAADDHLAEYGED